jgi:broad specificity phosphatase PhoE
VTGARLLVVRHGDTDWAAQRRHTGRTDVALNPDGERRATALRGRLPLDDVVAVWSSPLVRARRTAELAGLAIDEVVDDLIEWDYGAAEGRTTAEIRTEQPGWTVWDAPSPDGETAAEVGVRVDRVIARARTLDGTVVLVAHAHLLRILAVRWLGLPAVTGRHLTLDPGGWGLLGWERETPVVERWNPPAPSD